MFGRSSLLLLLLLAAAAAATMPPRPPAELGELAGYVAVHGRTLVAMDVRRSLNGRAAAASGEKRAVAANEALIASHTEQKLGVLLAASPTRQAHMLAILYGSG